MSRGFQPTTAKKTSASWVCRAAIMCSLCMCAGGAVGQGNAAPSTGSVLLHLQAARRAVSAKHLPAAEREARTALALDQNSAASHYLLGSVLFLQNRPAESLAAYTAGARLQPPAAEDLMTVGSDYVLLNDLPDADKWLNQAVKLAPANTRAWYLLGRTQYNEDHVTDAEHSFKQVLLLQPHDVRAEYNLGLVYEKLQRPADALAAYRTAIDWQSGSAMPDPQPFLDLGILLLSQGTAAEALAALDEAVRYGPDNPLAHQERGRALEALGRDEEAITSLERAAALAPESQQPHFFLARILKRLGRAQEAAVEYGTVSRLLGSHSDTPTPNEQHHP